MPRGKKTPPETIYKIMSSWATTKSYKQTADNLGLAVSTVKKIVDKHIGEEKFEKLCNEKERKFSEIADRIIFKAMRKLENELDDEEQAIPVNHLTTVIGTMYDKNVLYESDSGYVVMLDNLSDRQRQAWRDGNWDMLAGQYFSGFDRNVHVVGTFPIPPNWKLGKA